MEVPLTPLEFMRRARRLFGDREAVVDGSLRLTYEQFFDRCDRWSARAPAARREARRSRRVHRAEHARQLESFYAVPQIGAVLVPINYRLTADDFAYIIAHSGAKVVCAAPEYLEMIDGVRGRASRTSRTSSRSRARATAGSSTRARSRRVAPKGAPVVFERPVIREDDLLTINYTSGTTARPKGVMITHRNA